MSQGKPANTIDGVAIIGMAGRLPRASNVAEFWRNIRDGVECISQFSVEELEVPDAVELAKQPNYVRARSIIDNADRFDAAFFGILPKEAELVDPQQRIFLECCWEAIEDAGYDPQLYPGAIGVFAGSSPNTYFLRNLCADRDFVNEYTGAYQVGNYATLLGTNPDFLATRVSYKLNLKGPSFTVQCGCSTSLVAVCQACQSLLTYQSDMALAGGVSITFPQKRGYLYQEGGMASPDGHCRAFDSRAQGTVFGSGAAVVLLKRLEDALADGDHIYAVIKGFALNNDGAAKVGYTAPSADGQATVIAMAQAMANVSARSISYVEAHGTATPLGDPIEFAALTRAFRAQTESLGFCALGTAKMNVGHLDIAAGVTGLINVANMLTYRQLPPAIAFESPNPAIDLDDSPFYVNRSLCPWPEGATPRRAGVSAFGVGGTNAHVVLEEAPPSPRAAQGGAGQLLILSARSSAALDQATENLAEHLQDHADLDLDSVAYTLQAGRREFDHRRMLVCTDVADAITALKTRDSRRVFTRVCGHQSAPVVFMFPGQGAQYVGMGAGLYKQHGQFRRDVDTCAAILEPHLGFDLAAVLYSNAAGENGTPSELRETAVAQPSLFVIEYALARLWMSWGVQPEVMIGHSVGELVAACLSGVFALEDALALIAARGRMMQQLPTGAMLAVRLPELEIKGLLSETLSLAAVNSPQLCVVSGPDEAVDDLHRDLQERGVRSKLLATSHAFHSRMMDPIVQPFIERMEGVRLGAPRVPFVSGVTGEWIRDDEARDPAYWARHFREPVRFSEGVRQLQSRPERVFLEVGPGNTLCTLVRQHRDNSAELVAVPSLPDAPHQQDDSLSILAATGKLWLHGVTPLWVEMHDRATQRCSLPTYPFERQRYWVAPPSGPTVHHVPATDPRNSHVESTMQTSSRVNKVHEPTSDAAPTPNRRERIRAALTTIFEDLSGLSLAEVDASVTFLELGFDSLFLSQAIQALTSKFGLKLTFRQLLERESTSDALAEYIDSRLPPDAFGAEPASPLSAVEAPASVEMTGSTTLISTASNSVPVASVSPVKEAAHGMEAVVREQLLLMSKQLDALRAIGADGPLPAVAVAPGAPAPPPVAQVTATTNEPTAEPAATARDFKPFGPYKPVQKGQVGELTQQQARYLENLIKRYTARTVRSKEFTQTHRRVLADPRVAAGFRSQWKEMVYPIVTVRSHGSRLWDIDGNEYIDILNGFGPIMLGHAPQFVTDAVAQQLKDGFEIGPQTPLAGRVAELICEMTGVERATFCNTGSEAVMAAIRVARTVTARTRVVLFAGAYHGTFDEVLVKGIRKGGAPHSLPIAPGIPVEMVSQVTVLEFGTAESLDYIRQHAAELAAVLVEPVQSRHPSLQPVEFLREVRQITRQSGTALIFDEVVTGFRVHPGGAQALFGIRADLVTYGKVIGGGLPIGVLAGAAKFMDALDGGMWQYGDDSYPETGVTFFAGTFVRHPLALAAAHAVLTHLKEQGPELQRALSDKTARFVHRLNTHFEERGVCTRIEHFGSIFYFSLSRELPFGSLLYYHLREKGIHIQEGFPCFLTTTHTEDDVDQVIQAFRECIAEMQAAGALPGASHDDAQTSVPSQDAQAGDAGRPQEVPITEAQMEIWLSARMSDEANCAYNESFTLHMHGALNQLALRDALQQLIDRHDALRSTFDPKGRFFRVHSALPIDVPVIDLSSIAAAERDERIGHLIRDDANLPFDLVSGPLVRAVLIKLSHDHHALLFTSHHIVCDGWSTNVLLAELSQLYDSQCSGATCNLPPALQFMDYARAQVDWLRSAERADTEAWWCETFAAPVVPLELPTDRPRGSVKSFRGDTVRTSIGAAEYQRIKRFSARQGCTLFATLLSAFKILLFRITAQPDVVVGIPTAGQSLLDGDSLVGHCVNFLPLRSVVQEDMTVSSHLAQEKDILLDAYEHQSYTYGSLVRKLALPRDPSRLPLMEVQFNLERVGAALDLNGLKVDVDPNPKSFVNFDLFLNIIESEQGLALDCDYNRDLLDRETVERWLRHYETLLNAMTADASRLVSRLCLLGESERQRMLAQWNDTQVDYPRDKCVHHLIEEQAERTPGAVAAVFEDRQLTYAELNDRASQLGNHLRQLGVCPGSTVAICLDRSLEMLIGVLGVLKAGGAYVPLDPNYPNERITAVIDDATPSLLLTQERIAAQLGSLSTRLVYLDRDWDTMASQSHGDSPAGASPRDLAYVIYTSGSTGKPKGVAITHRSVVNLLWSMKHQPGMDTEDRLLAVTTLAFDIAGLELFLPLCVGARVIIAAPDVVGDGDKLLALLNSSGATVMQATPASWRLLLEAGWTGSGRLKILCGGEALPRDLAELLVPRGASLWNMYGPTETTIWSATSRVASGSGPVTIGPPIANTQFYVLDPMVQPVPIGVPGELYIGGDGVARGYWNRPQLTAEKFVKNPFSGDPAARLYRTGDLVRFLSDGRLEFLGRLDTQVKVRGFRIETAEVESVLMQNPGVRECVVVAREDTPGDNRLVAYLVAGNPVPATTDLRSFIAMKLPDYMVPSIFVRLDALPRTPNGKVDRRRLPRPDAAQVAHQEDYVAPVDSHEQTLADICAEVLRLDRVSTHDNLFDLGADSLHVFQIVARANDAGVKLSAQQILADRTVSAICGSLTKMTNGIHDDRVPQLVPVSREQYRIKRSLLS